MSEKLEDITLNQSILSRSGSRAKTSALRATDLGLTAPDRDCGLKGAALLANYDPDSHSWKTSQRCLTGGWAEFSRTWPRSGMTRNGTAYQLASLAHSICAKGSLS